MANNEKDKGEKNGGLFVPAGALIGLGAGFLLGDIPAGLFIGLGCGFLLFGITAILKK